MIPSYILLNGRILGCNDLVQLNNLNQEFYTLF